VRGLHTGLPKPEEFTLAASSTSAAGPVIHGGRQSKVVWLQIIAAPLTHTKRPQRGW
jgi:hypothetical protein